MDDGTSAPAELAGAGDTAWTQIVGRLVSSSSTSAKRPTMHSGWLRRRAPKASRANGTPSFMRPPTIRLLAVLRLVPCFVSAGSGAECVAADEAGPAPALPAAVGGCDGGGEGLSQAETAFWACTASSNEDGVEPAPPPAPPPASCRLADGEGAGRRGEGLGGCSSRPVIAPDWR